MSGRVDSLKCGEWQRRMSRFRASGVSVAAFCRAERVSIPSFYQWRKKLTRSSAEAAIAQAGFTPVRLVTAAHLGTAANIAVQLPGGTQLQIPTGDLPTVRLVIQLLMRADAEQTGGEPC